VTWSIGVPGRIAALTGVAAPVRRNVLLLAGGLAALYGMVELASAVATLTFVSAGGSRRFAGLAPAVFLASAALAAFPAGRSMDRVGRAPILRIGFGVGFGGSLMAALGAFSSSVPVVVLGFVMVGASTGTVMLSRAAAADMYGPDRRAQGIALVLFGAVFGAVLGPAVFVPLVAAGALKDSSSLGPAWIGAAGFMVVGLGLMMRVRPDPQQIARELAPEPQEAASPGASIRELVSQPGIRSALVGAVASWAVMVALMTLAGSALVAHGHDRVAIFPALSAHFAGMFALFPLVGSVIERVGRARALIAGLTLLAASALSLVGALDSVALTSVAMFAIGLGWSFAYVAATTALTESTSPAGRGKLLGLSDLLSGLAGAGLTVAAGAALDSDGIAVVGVTGALVAGVTALFLVIARARFQPA